MVKGMETCACCGYKTIEEKGNFEICPICYWEDDPVQEADPWVEGGANVPSLFTAQHNYENFGAMEERFVPNIRAARPDDIKDSTWRELTEGDKKFCTTPREIEKAWGTENQISYNYWERNA
jgi:hypothetical protein